MDVIYIIFAYLLGSVPTAYIYFRIKQNKDIRNYGSGNSGALNIWRSQNISSGALVLIIDLIKAISIALTGKNIEISEVGFYIGTVCSVLGHNYPVYLKFKGGKGVSVVAGITLVIITIPSFIAGITIGIIGLITKSPLWGILVGALVLNGLTLIIEQSISLSIWCAVISLIVGVTHFSRRKEELITAIKNMDLNKIGKIE
ncbi:glycerol-3-phosphate acyltransferase [Chloroflexi bacterium]|nr:glycerol-3-phosphate acyltransferase [Chloroflexota bacterium]|tara:strand:+ start:441 stop:1043 length:603 start_codon:yes stop_codon:yes gene_type:complete